VAKVTVGLVMAAYNSLPYIEESVQSLFDQTFTDFVCCIVDDGSSDGTNVKAQELVARDSRFMFVQQHHSGVSTARNYGVAHLPDTKYLCFPDSDDVWRSEALSDLFLASEQLGGVGAHALCDEIDSTGAPLQSSTAAEFRRQRFIAGILRSQSVPLDCPSTFESIVQSCTFYPPGLVLMRRDTFDKVGGFDLSLWQYEDWDLHIRISRYGDFAFLNKVVVDYRRHSTQSVNNPWIKEMYQVVGAKTLRSPLNTPQQRKAAARAWRTSEFLRAIGMVHSAFNEIKGRQLKSAALELKDVPMQIFRGIVGPVRIRIPEQYPH
jgi:glycosyltransferase involved in cell wall biosynthesis